MGPNIAQNRSKSAFKVDQNRIRKRYRRDLAKNFDFGCDFGASWGRIGAPNRSFSEIFRLQVALVCRRRFRIASDIDFGAFALLKTAFPPRRESNFQVFVKVALGIDFGGFGIQKGSENGVQEASKRILKSYEN